MGKDSKRIILIEGKQSEHPSFFLSLRAKGYEVELAKNGAAALLILAEKPASLILLDAASLRTNGNRIVYSLKKRYPDTPVIMVIDDRLKEKKTSARADLILTLPFTICKLTNRIKTFLPPEIGDFEAFGDIRLDVTNRLVYVKRRPASLTPRLTAILQILLDNAGEPVNRTELYQAVWNTNYVEDIRSMDVHICWLREAIEPNPKKPEYLITMRGKGYCLYPFGKKNKKD